VVDCLLIVQDVESGAAGEFALAALQDDDLQVEGGVGRTQVEFSC